MKRILALLFVLMLALNFSACGDDDDDDTEDTPTYSISGTITLASDNTALADITVALSGDSTASTTTDDDGAYTLTVEAGDYTITPQTATGYIFDPENIAVTISSVDVADEDFTSTKVNAAAYLHYTFPDQYTYESNGGAVADEAAALFSGYTLTDGIVYKTDSTTGATTETASGYAVDQFVDEDDVIASTPDPDGLLAGITEAGNDARELYSTVVVSNQDGFDNRNKFMGSGSYNADLKWDQFIQFYLLDLNYSAKVHFPGSVAVPATLAKMYNVKYAYDIYMFRKIDVKRPDTDGTIAVFEIGATTDSYVEDATYTTSTTLSTTKFTESNISFTNSTTSIIYTDIRAISLDQFLTTYVVSDASTNANYTFSIVGLDESSLTGLTYANMQQAYYLPDYDFICQVDSSTSTMVSGTKISFPVRIEVVTSDTATISAADSYDYDSYGAPAYAIYDDADNGAE